MSTANPDENERKYWPAPIWKSTEDKKVDNSEPLITRYVGLPEKVSVKFLAEISGQTLYDLAAQMHQLRIFISVDRSVDFDDAAKLLRRYGIAAQREV